MGCEALAMSPSSPVREIITPRTGDRTSVKLKFSLACVRDALAAS